MSFLFSPHFWKFKGLALLYFAGVFNFVFHTQKKKLFYTGALRTTVNREVSVIVDMYMYNALIFIY